MARANSAKEYKKSNDYWNDRKKGTKLIKSILVDANKKANEIEGVKKTVYERLQSVSSYANPKNTFLGSSWREGHSEVMGKYIQSHKSSSDIFGKLVYNETLRRFKNGQENKENKGN